MAKTTRFDSDFHVEGSADVSGDFEVGGSVYGDLIGDVTGSVTGTINGLEFPAFTVDDTDKVLTIVSDNNLWTITPSDVTADGGTFIVTVDDEDTTALAFSAANTDIAAAIEVAVPALDGLVTVTGDIGDATFTIEFLDARPHTVATDAALLTGGDSPYTLDPVETDEAVAEHMEWVAP